MRIQGENAELGTAGLHIPPYTLAWGPANPWVTNLVTPTATLPPTHSILVHTDTPKPWTSRQPLPTAAWSGTHGQGEEEGCRVLPACVHAACCRAQ